jgi:flagellar hook-length control protein FliK
MFNVKTSGHSSISTESAGTSGTSPSEAVVDNSQAVPEEAVAPSKNASQASVINTPLTGTISTLLEPNTQEQPIGIDQPVNAREQFVAERSENKDSTRDAKVFEQNEKSRTSSISVTGEHGQALPDSRVEQVEPKEMTKSRRPVARDEEIHPAAEKGSELNQRPDGPVAANGPVKEAQTPELHGKPPAEYIHAEAVEVAQQVIRHMKANLSSGATSMHLQLNPKELGAIEVDMVSSSQGVQVTFFAEQASTGRLLETQLNQLRESLVDSGVQLSGLQIGQHNTPGQKGGMFGRDTNFAPFTQQNFVESTVQDAPTVERSIGQSTEIDYRV